MVHQADRELDGAPPRQRTGLDQKFAEVRALEQLEDGVGFIPVAVVGEHPHDRGVVDEGQAQSFS